MLEELRQADSSAGAKVPEESQRPEEQDEEREEWVRWDDGMLERSIDESPGGLFGDEGGGQKPEKKED